MDASSASRVSEDSRTSMAFFGFEGKASPGRDAPNTDSELLTGSNIIVRTGKEQNSLLNARSTLVQFVFVWYQCTCSATYSANFRPTLFSSKPTAPRSVVPRVIAFL